MNDQFGYLKEGGHDVRFVELSYESMYLLANLNFICLVAAVLLVMWLLAFLKDRFASKYSKIWKLRERFWHDRVEGELHNFIHRFYYEVFLELLICAMISLASTKPYIDDNSSINSSIQT